MGVNVDLFIFLASRTMDEPIFFPMFMAVANLRIPTDLIEKKNDGSMVLVYMVCHGSHQYTPVMLAYISAPWIRHGVYNQ